jgi:serine/threonine protein kinase
LWKKGIRHGDISLGNLMWDDRRKVGVLNDFDLSRFAGQTGASGQDNAGTLPFMALDLLSEEGLRGGIPRRYRHEAESFAWSLIFLYFGTVEDIVGGNNRTRDPHPLYRWFEDWEISLKFKKGLEWRDGDVSGISLAHPNTRRLARALHEYWVDRYNRQLAYSSKGGHPRPSPDTEQSPGAEDAKIPDHERILQMFNPTITQLTEVRPHEEPEDENLVRELVYIHVRELLHYEPTDGLVVRMGERYNDLDWAA